MFEHSVVRGREGASSFFILLYRTTTDYQHCAYNLNPLLLSTQLNSTTLCAFEKPKPSNICYEDIQSNYIREDSLIVDNNNLNSILILIIVQTQTKPTTYQLTSHSWMVHIEDKVYILLLFIVWFLSEREKWNNEKKIIYFTLIFILFSISFSLIIIFTVSLFSTPQSCVY